MVIQPTKGPLDSLKTSVGNFRGETRGHWIIYTLSITSPNICCHPIILPKWHFQECFWNEANASVWMAESFMLELTSKTWWFSSPERKEALKVEPWTVKQNTNWRVWTKMKDVKVGGHLWETKCVTECDRLV